MRLPRLRLSVRRMMILVAAVTLACGGVVLRQRSVVFARMADIHRRLADAERAKPPAPAATGGLDLNFSVDLESRHDTDFDDLLVAIGERPPGAGAIVIEYHARMARRYENAARHPWLAGPETPPATRPATGYSTLDGPGFPVEFIHVVSSPAVPDRASGAEVVESRGNWSSAKAVRP